MAPTRVEVTFHVSTSVEMVRVILKTISRTRTLKGGGFGPTAIPHPRGMDPVCLCRRGD